MPFLALFLALWPGSARAIDCSAPSSDYETRICARADLIAVDRKIELALAAAEADMDEDGRLILSERHRNWKTDMGLCARQYRDCDAEMTERLRFLRGEPATGPEMGQRLALTAYRSKPIEDRGLRPQLVQRFREPGTAAERLFNAIVDEIIARDRQPAQEEPASLLLKLQLTFASDRLFSALHDIAFPQTENSGDGWIERHNINIDVRQGTLLDIAAVFPEESLKVLEEHCIRQMTAKLVERAIEWHRDMGVVRISPDGLDMMRETVAQRIRQQQGWTFRPEESVVTFNEGTFDYVPFGWEVCRFKAAELRQLAHPDAPLP